MSLQLICGVDEAGRGPLAGAVYAAAVILDPVRPIPGINDSKKLTEKKRDQLAIEIKQHALAWAIARSSVEEIDEIPAGAVTIFSAHGVSKKVENGAELRSLDVIDATCPLVTKVHKEGRRYAERGYDIVLIGHIGHPEVEGTLGQIPGTVHVLSEVHEVETLEVADPGRVAFVTQTTLSVNDTKDVIAALRKRFPSIVGPDTRDICYATQNRQTAVIELCKQIDALRVVGAHNSSNSNRLREIGENYGLPSYLIEDASMLDLDWVKDAQIVGVTAGASAPETLVQETIAKLRTVRDVSVVTLDGVRENVHFKLPAELADVPRPKDAMDAWAVETA